MIPLGWRLVQLVWTLPLKFTSRSTNFSFNLLVVLFLCRFLHFSPRLFLNCFQLSTAFFIFTASDLQLSGFCLSQFRQSWFKSFPGHSIITKLHKLSKLIFSSSCYYCRSSSVNRWIPLNKQIRICTAGLNDSLLYPWRGGSCDPTGTSSTLGFISSYQIFTHSMLRVGGSLTSIQHIFLSVAPY